MLKRVQIENYRCFRHVDVPLKPLTVLIGTNNTGKSNFLSAISAARTSLRDPPSSRMDSWKGQGDVRPSVILTSDDGAEFQVVPRQSNESSWQQLNDAMVGVVLPMRCYGIGSLSPTMESPGIDETFGIPSINDNADNIAGYLDSLLRHDRPRFDRVIEDLRQLVPGLRDLRLPTPGAAMRRVDLLWDNGFPMEGKHASEGVKVMLFFIALAQDPTPPRVILVEEPENKVHPRALEAIVKQLVSLTDGRNAAYPTQVILTTHSPYLMDFIDPVRHQVLVTQHEPDGSKSVTPVDEERLQIFLDDFGLGEVWINRGEAGLIRKDAT